MCGRVAWKWLLTFLFFLFFFFCNQSGDIFFAWWKRRPNWLLVWASLNSVSLLAIAGLCHTSSVNPPPPPLHHPLGANWKPPTVANWL